LGLREVDGQTNRKALTALASGPAHQEERFARVILDFLGRCYGERASNTAIRRLAVRTLARARKVQALVPFLLSVMETEDEASVAVAAAEALGGFGLSSEAALSVRCLLGQDPWSGLQVLLATLRCGTLSLQQAAVVAPDVEKTLAAACAVSHNGPEEYLIPDCVEVLVRAAALRRKDPTAELQPLLLWSDHVVDSAAVWALYGRIEWLRPLLEPQAAAFLDDILVLYTGL
jgi:HEAT repeat protein